MFGVVGKNQHRGQFGEVALRLRPDEPPVVLACEVLRITPDGLRIAVAQVPTVPLTTVFTWNREVELTLRMPLPICSVKTRGHITGMAMNYDRKAHPFLIDIAFPDLTAEEEEALCSSNPELVVI